MSGFWFVRLYILLVLLWCVCYVRFPCPVSCLLSVCSSCSVCLTVPVLSSVLFSVLSGCVLCLCPVLLLVSCPVCSFPVYSCSYLCVLCVTYPSVPCLFRCPFLACSVVLFP